MSDEARRYFASRFTPDERREAVWRHLVPYIVRFAPPDARVLELGAGYCSFINRVSAPRRVAVDLWPATADHAAPGVEVRIGDALEVLAGLGDGEFDFVFASNFLEHFEWPALDRLAAEVWRLLAPGGRLALVQPNFRLNPRRYFDDYTHRTIFTDVSLSDWLAASGFAIAHVEPRFMPLTVKSRLGGLHALVPLYLRLPWRPLAGQLFLVAERPPRAEKPGGAVR